MWQLTRICIVWQSFFSHKITSEGVCRSPTHSILVFSHNDADSHQKESGNREKIKRDKRQRHRHRNKQSMRRKKLKATPIQSLLHASSEGQFVDKRWHRLSQCGGQKAWPIHWHVGRFVMTQSDTGHDGMQCLLLLSHTQYTSFAFDDDATAPRTDGARAVKSSGSWGIQKKCPLVPMPPVAIRTESSEPWRSPPPSFQKTISQNALQRKEKSTVICGSEAHPSIYKCNP